MEDREKSGRETGAPSAGDSRGFGISMIAGGVALLALVLVFFPRITRWFEYFTAATALLLALVLVVGGVVIAIRKGDKRD